MTQICGKTITNGNLCRKELRAGHIPELSASFRFRSLSLRVAYIKTDSIKYEGIILPKQMTVALLYKLCLKYFT